MWILYNEDNKGVECDVPRVANSRMNALQSFVRWDASVWLNENLGHSLIHPIICNWTPDFYHATN